MEDEDNPSKLAAAWLADNMANINLNDVSIRTSEPGILVQVAYGDIAKESAHRQMVVGAAVGSLAGALSARSFTSLALAVVLAVAILQVGVYNDWVSMDVTKATKSMTSARVWAEEAYARHHVTLYPVHRFYRDNFFIALGFAAGFSVGFLLFV